MVPDVDRVVEVLVPPIADEEWGFGSGYELTDGIVLTARHVLGDRDQALVRFRGGRPGELKLDGTLAWGAPGLDVALVRVTTPNAPESIEVPSFGAPEEVAGEIPFVAVGFPLFKRMLEGDHRAVRDSQQIDGSIPLAANLKSGRLALQTRAHPPRPLADRSPWEGMSGAAVFSGAHLVGVVTVHRTPEGDATLTAARIADVARVAGEDRRRFWKLLGLDPDAAEVEPLGPVVHGDVAYDPITLRARLRRVFDPLIASRTELFGGRVEEHDRVVEFIRGRPGGYLVVTAPAGFGKTAFAASIVEEQPEAFAYHFFSPLYGGDTLREGFFLRNVVEQLAEWHDRAAAAPSELQLNDLRALYQDLIDSPLRRTQVLVIDGLDEVRDWSLHPYLSRRLPERLHVIATVRDVGQDWRGEYGFPRDQLQQLEMGGLSRSGVAEVFTRAGGAAADLAGADDVLDEIMRVASRGEDAVGAADPFYVRLLAEDAAAGLVTAANLSERPQGLDRYLDGWWQEIKETREQEGRDVVGFLAVARGPIGREDLEALVPAVADAWELDRLDAVVRDMRRLIVRTDAGFAFAHPLLAEYLATRIRTDRYSTQLLEYCGRWNENRSEYAFEHYAEHLVDAGDRSALYAVVNEGWMRAQLARTGTHRAFAFDLQRVCGALEADERVDLVLEVRAELVLASLGALAYEIPAEALEALAWIGEVEAALDWAGLIDADWRRLDAYCRIGDVLVQTDDRRRAMEVFRLALPLAAKVAPDRPGGPDGRTFNVAEGLARAGDVQAAVRAVPSGDDAANGRLLVRLAAVVERVGADADAALLVERAVAAAEDAASPRLLAAVAAELTETGHAERGAVLTKQALEALATSTWRNDFDRLQALSIVAANIARADPAEARARLDEVRRRFDPGQGGPRSDFVARTLLRGLADVGEAEAVIEAATDNERVRERFFAQCVAWLARAGNVEAALSLAQQPAFLESGAHVGEAAAALVEAGEGDAAWTLLKAGDGYQRSEAIQRMAAVVSRRAEHDEMQRFLPRALAEAEALTPPEERADALAAVAVVAARLGDHGTSRRLAYEARDGAPTGLDLESPIRTLARFGLAHGAYGRTEESRRLANQALALAAKLSNDYALGRLCESLLPLLVSVGSVDAARALVDGLSEERDQPQHHLAIALAQSGDFDAAESVALGIDDHYWKVWALKRCADAAGWAGDPAAARRFAERARDEADNAEVDSFHHDELLGAAASALAVAGEPEEARTLAEVVDDADARSEVFAELQEATGDGDAPSPEGVAAAQAAAEDEPDLQQRAASLSEVSRTWLALGEVARARAARDLALQAARGLHSGVDRKWPLIWMAPAFAESGDADRLVTAIEEMADGESRAEAFVGLAMGLAELVDVDEGLRVWRRGLHDGRRVSRWSAYMSLEDGAMLLGALDEGATMSSIADAIVAIEGWWASPG